MHIITVIAVMFC